MAATQLTGQSVVTFALEQIGVYGVGQTLSASDANTGLRRLNAMISSLGIQALSKLVVAREVFDLVANQSSYTIGPGANFNTTRPTSLQNATLLLNSSSPSIEIPLALLTDQAYQNIRLKTQTNTLPTAVYYQPTFTTSGYGTVILWPVPDTADNDLVLYFQQSLVTFANLTTEYYWPEGAEEMLGYNLALRLCAPYARPVPDTVGQMAKSSLATFKRANTRMSDLSNDAAAIGSANGIYNINTDQSQAS